LFIEDKPLRSRTSPKKKNPGVSTLPVGSVDDLLRERMEDKYLVYDHSKPLGSRSYHSGQPPQLVISVVEKEGVLETTSVDTIGEGEEVKVVDENLPSTSSS
jgi:hypothetical protein